MSRKTFLSSPIVLLALAGAILAGVLIGRLSHRIPSPSAGETGGAGATAGAPPSPGAGGPPPTATAGGPPSAPPATGPALSAAVDTVSADRLGGMDVSHFNGSVHWPSVEPSQISFVFIKATGGHGFVDPMFTLNWHGAREVGLVRGAYHVFYDDIDPVEQARHFNATVGTFRPSDLPVVDVETIPKHAITDSLARDVLRWLAEVESHWGRKPIVYASTSFYRAHLSPALDGYPWWVAEYRSTAPSTDRGWAFWQHTDAGQVSSVDGGTRGVDLDLFRGGSAELRRFLDTTRVRN